MREKKAEDAKSRSRIEERFGRDWGVELPESIFRFWSFLGSLDPAGQQALADVAVAPAGILDVFADPGLRPREGVDVTVHGRFYRDPPEFLTFMYSGSDGLHHGLWFDDGRSCSKVASYYTRDGGGIDSSHRTPLEAVRAVLELCWRDLEGEAGRDGAGADAEVWARLSRLRSLRSVLTAFETGDRPEVGLAYSQTYDFPRPPVDHRRITTLDGAGALVAGETALDRPAHNGADEYRFGKYMYALFEATEALEECVRDALRRCASGDPAEALVLGRDLHWASAGDPAREARAHELLVAAYRVLDRPSLALIADAHHRHRALPDVRILELPRS
jgi:hypothetical protein